jgi:hypothetical protein
MRQPGCMKDGGGPSGTPRKSSTRPVWDMKLIWNSFDVGFRESAPALHCCGLFCWCCCCWSIFC